MYARIELKFVVRLRLEVLTSRMAALRLQLLLLYQTKHLAKPSRLLPSLLVFHVAIMLITHPPPTRKGILTNRHIQKSIVHGFGPLERDRPV